MIRTMETRIGIYCTNTTSSTRVCASCFSSLCYRADDGWAVGEDFLRQLLEYRPERRMTPEQALTHAWVSCQKETVTRRQCWHTPPRAIISLELRYFDRCMNSWNIASKSSSGRRDRLEEVRCVGSRSSILSGRASSAWIERRQDDSVSK